MGKDLPLFYFCYYLNGHKGFYMQDKTLLKCKYEVTLNYPVKKKFTRNVEGASCSTDHTLRRKIMYS